MSDADFYDSTYEMFRDTTNQVEETHCGGILDD